MECGSMHCHQRSPRVPLRLISPVPGFVWSGDVRVVEEDEISSSSLWSVWAGEEGARQARPSRLSKGWGQSVVCFVPTPALSTGPKFCAAENVTCKARAAIVTGADGKETRGSVSADPLMKTDLRTDERVRWISRVEVSHGGATRSSSLMFVRSRISSGDPMPEMRAGVLSVRCARPWAGVLL